MKGTAIHRTDLDPNTREAMFKLLRQSFTGISTETFYADLNEKNWIILIRNNADALIGFSTLLQYRTRYKDQNLCVIYSGDTIMDSSGWNSFVLPATWIKTVRSICPIERDERLLWLLLSSGYRTYRFLPVFWRQFYPRYDLPTPQETRMLMDYLGRKKFGSQYNQTTGIVRFSTPQSLKAGLVHVPNGKRTNPHVAHFLKLNPGYVQGDELLCLTELNDTNLTAAGRRVQYSIRSAYQNYDYRIQQ